MTKNFSPNVLTKKISVKLTKWSCPVPTGKKLFWILVAGCDGQGYRLDRLAKEPARGIAGVVDVGSESAVVLVLRRKRVRWREIGDCLQIFWTLQGRLVAGMSGHGVAFLVLLNAG